MKTLHKISKYNMRTDGRLAYLDGQKDERERLMKIIEIIAQDPTKTARDVYNYLFMAFKYERGN